MTDPTNETSVVDPSKMTKLNVACKTELEKLYNLNEYASRAFMESGSNILQSRR